jgi:predicted transcriptional regulator
MLFQDLHRWCNLNKKQLLLLEWLFTKKKGCSLQMEHDLYLRQTDVSQITNMFIKKGWLTYTIVPLKNSRGRPVKEYSLINEEHVLAELYQSIKQNKHDIESAMNTLKEFQEEQLGDRHDN